jgi:hypothetical protein
MVTVSTDDSLSLEQRYINFKGSYKHVELDTCTTLLHLWQSIPHRHKNSVFHISYLRYCDKIIMVSIDMKIDLCRSNLDTPPTSPPSLSPVCVFWAVFFFFPLDLLVLPRGGVPPNGTPPNLFSFLILLLPPPPPHTNVWIYPASL